MSKFHHDLNNQLKSYSKTIPKLSKSVVRPLIQLASRSVDGCSFKDDPLALIESRIGPCEELPEFYTIILILMQLYFRAPQGSIKATDLKEYLEELSFKQEVIEDICATLFGPHAPQLSSTFIKSLNPLNQANQISWKIDISLIHSAISHLAQPSVILRITLSNGQTKTFEITSKLFHKLRHSVALLLQNMIVLENKNVLKHF